MLAKLERLMPIDWVCRGCVGVTHSVTNLRRWEKLASGRGVVEGRSGLGWFGVVWCNSRDAEGTEYLGGMGPCVYGSAGM